MSGGRPRSGAWAQEAETATPPPQTSERYVCTERLAVGGMGVVWRARDTELNRDVAYKSVLMGATEETHVRLVQEARLAAQLGLTGVVQVYDHGTDRDGRPFYAMELLTFPLFSGELQADLQALVSVAETVGQAHAAGLVHRDLKPSNLGRRGTDAVVADWGLARPFSSIEHWDRSVLSNQRAQTRTGVGLGTAGYMAPEQLTGEGCDPRADVWSLAAVLHELITGEPPFNPDGTHRLLNAVVGGKLDVPPGALGEVARRGLSLDQNLRQPNGTAFAAELRLALTPPPPPRPRWPWLVSAGALLAAVTVVALRPQPSHPELEQVASNALAEQSWLLYATGRLSEAHAQAVASTEIAVTPRANGVLAAPVAASPVPVEDHQACERTALDQRRDLLLCLEGSRLSLRSSAGEERWTREVSALSQMKLDNGVATLRDGWQLHIVQEDGTTLSDSAGTNVVEFGVLDGEPIKRMGPQVLWRDQRVADAVGWLGPSTAQGQVMHLRNDTIARVNADGSITEGPALAEPLVGWGLWDDTLTLVGLRGKVLNLDVSSLELRSTYSLGQASQIMTATVSASGDVAASTPHGVILYDRQTPKAQLTTTPSRELAFQQNGSLLLQGSDGLSSWSPMLDRTHVAWSDALSITALQLRTTDQVYVGTSNGAGHASPLTLEGGFTDLGRGPFRSIAQTNFTTVIGAPGGHWDTDKRLWEKGYEIGAAIGTDTLVLGKLHTPGLAWRTAAGEVSQNDTPNFVQLVSGVPNDHALGRDNEGKVWRITADQQLVPLDVEPVTYVQSSTAGLWVARGSEVSLEGRFTAQVTERVTVLAAGQNHLAAGTVGGKLWVWTHDGTLLAQMDAHGERVSALELVGTTLLSGSWQPGLRRWSLEGLAVPER